MLPLNAKNETCIQGGTDKSLNVGVCHCRHCVGVLCICVIIVLPESSRDVRREMKFSCDVGGCL